ncbi:hypothetical protein EYR41_005727 [Orbilia oligospora]|uniref:Uncharacterized protein n=1 Tax=Orbilia oligospora TaxID=2813651 RepID=A0A8H2HRV3_ORBOL|nr:hypothetical protein EYR41_005727 [Orbilia oligospora]
MQPNRGNHPRHGFTGPRLVQLSRFYFRQAVQVPRGERKAKGRAYQEPYKARKRGGFDGEEYVDTLAFMSTKNRSRTPDLQDFMFSQGLESWLWHQGVPFVADEGRVEEISGLDDVDIFD